MFRRGEQQQEHRSLKIMQLPYFTGTAFLGALETSNLFGFLLFGVLYSSPT